MKKTNQMIHRDIKDPIYLQKCAQKKYNIRCEDE